ncbi:MAG: glycerophosphoryl diester phosphodiesterase [Halanaerobiales bacterium]|nr:glycerophosphoryl diester phosphodiesterase [Halanaerobiales bacterium]
MKPYIIGHRGAMGSAPENTAISFRKALAAGADGVEFDVHMTKDNRLVVIHDERIDRTTDGRGWVKDLTLEEIKGVDAGSYYGPEFAGQRILTLEETLEIVKESRIINIELKNGPIFYPGLEERVIKVITDFRIKEKVIISSFNHYSIHKVKQIAPEVKCGLLYMAGLYQPWEYARNLGVEAIHPYFAGIIPEIVTRCHDHKIEVNVFGVNDEGLLTKMIKLGVDMLITDYPEKALRLKRRV